MELPTNLNERILTLEDFEKRPLSHTSLGFFKRSPQHFLHYWYDKPAPTQAMIFGNLFHVMILEPDNVESRFLTMPDFGRTKAELQAKREFIEANAGKTLIKQDMWDDAEWMRDSVYSNESAQNILNQVHTTEKRIEWTHKDTGLPIKSYIDGISDTFLLELKTTTDAMPAKFERDAFNNEYYRQAGLYLDGYVRRSGKMLDFMYIAVEKSEPYGISIFRATEDYIELGKKEYRRLLEHIAFCCKFNKWQQSYDFYTASPYHQLDLPGYGKRMLEEIG